MRRSRVLTRPQTASPVRAWRPNAPQDPYVRRPTVTTHPDEPLVVGLRVLYEDEPDGRVAHIPQVLGAVSRGEDRRSARAGVRDVLRD